MSANFGIINNVPTGPFENTVLSSFVGGSGPVGPVVSLLPTNTLISSTSLGMTVPDVFTFPLFFVDTFGRQTGTRANISLLPDYTLFTNIIYGNTSVTNTSTTDTYLVFNSGGTQVLTISPGETASTASLPDGEYQVFNGQTYLTTFQIFLGIVNDGLQLSFQANPQIVTINPKMVLTVTNNLPTTFTIEINGNTVPQGVVSLSSLGITAQGIYPIIRKSDGATIAYFTVFDDLYYYTGLSFMNNFITNSDSFVPGLFQLLGGPIVLPLPVGQQVSTASLANGTYSAQINTGEPTTVAQVVIIGNNLNDSLQMTFASRSSLILSSKSIAPVEDFTNVVIENKSKKDITVASNFHLFTLDKCDCSKLTASLANGNYFIGDSNSQMSEFGQYNVHNKIITIIKQPTNNLKITLLGTNTILVSSTINECKKVCKKICSPKCKKSKNKSKSKKKSKKHCKKSSKSSDSDDSFLFRYFIN